MQNAPMSLTLCGKSYGVTYGDRAVNDVLGGGIRQADIPAQLAIPLGEADVNEFILIPVRDLEKPINGRSTLMRFTQ